MNLTRRNRIIFALLLALPVSAMLDYAFKHDSVLAALAGGIGIYYILKLAAKNFGKLPEPAPKNNKKK